MIAATLTEETVIFGACVFVVVFLLILNQTNKTGKLPTWFKEKKPKK